MPENLLIFTDIRGCIAREKYKGTRFDGYVKNPAGIVQLNRIAWVTRARLIITDLVYRSHSLRSLQTMLYHYGVEAATIGKLEDRQGGMENNLLKWMGEHKKIDRYAIIGQEAPNHPALHNQWVRPNYGDGLSEADASQVIALLGF